MVVKASIRLAVALASAVLASAALVTGCASAGSSQAADRLPEHGQAP
jgi:hypothetical protein